MTILDYMWHIAKYSVYGVKIKFDELPEPVEVIGINTRNLEFETIDGSKIIPHDFARTQLYLFPLSHLDDDDLYRYNAWKKELCSQSDRNNEKILDLINKIEELFCSRHIDYLNLISSNLAIDATGKGIYGNLE